MLKERVRFAVLVVIGGLVLGCSEGMSQLAPTPPVPSLTGQYSASVIADMRSCQVSNPLGLPAPLAMAYIGSGPLNQTVGHVTANWKAAVTQLTLDGTLAKDGVLAFTLKTLFFSPYTGATNIEGSGTATVQPDGRIVGTFQGEAVHNYGGRVDTCRSDANTIELRRSS